MTTQEKIAFLMETIPSEKEVLELKKRYLFGALEAELLSEASRTLQSSRPDTHLIDWAYELLRHYSERNATRVEQRLPMQEKMERIIALFSNPEDLQSVLQAEEWSPSDRRAIQLVSHFVANDIPLASNVKIVDKVYRLLENAFLPPAIAARYFGKAGRDSRREEILEKYRAYREKRARPQGEPTPPRQEHPLKRYIYIIGAVSAVLAIFMSGFITARILYGNRADAGLTPVAMESILQKQAKKAENSPKEANATDPGERAMARQLAVSRLLLQEGLEEYGLPEKVDFSCKALGGAIADALPGEEEERQSAKGLLPGPASRAVAPPKGALKVAIAGISRLQGLRLPLQRTEENLSLGMPLPEGFRLHAQESPEQRILYLSDGTAAYPVEVYSFAAEPTIVRYRFIHYEPKHFMPVISDIWHFSDIGELRMHKHFVYQKDRITPAKIITNHFLPGGETLEMVSVGKLDGNKRPKELPLRRRDYFFNGKLLYAEDHELDRLDGRWRSRTVRQVWYDGGRKIRAKELAARE